MKFYTTVCIGILVLFCFSCKKVSCTDSELKYSYFVAGHTYGKPGIDNIGFHPPFRDVFSFLKEEKKMDFGVLTGDIVLTGTEQNWNEVDVDISELGLPIYFAVGNHDMTDRELFESRYGETYYSFTKNDDLFIVLDPNIDNWNISGEQLDFLAETLTIQASDANNIFVFFHQLLWWDSNNIYQNVILNSLANRAEQINFWTEVEPLFSVLSNPVYMFAGDVGAFNTGSEFMFHEYENISFIASGMGGEERDNIIIVDVNENNCVDLRLVALNGSDLNALGDLKDYTLP